MGSGFIEGDFIQVKIKKSELALFKYIIESYENIATITTLNTDAGLIEIYIPRGNLKTVKDLLSNLKREVAFTIVEE